MTPERWQQIRGVLEEALELPLEQRSAFLQRNCSGDPSLRQEVETLLASTLDARSSFLQSFPIRVTPTSGTKLGDYEVKSLLGSGGMGEVYRARDLRLGRDVAIKVLPSFLSADRDRLRRFEQEARAAAALNHPNILAVHQLGAYEGAPYLVSELLEGETLREQLRRGRLSVRKTIDYGVQIARGLAAAHEKGIVHRDLKPENLFVTKDGRLKILDFGLAKLTQRQLDSDGCEPTETEGTDAGLVMGTPGYMSPEQVRGKTVDHRADIFAFGATLYEMLVGKRAFKRATSAETMTAILNEDPPGISQIVQTAPPGLSRVVHRCLEKDPEQRFQSASDLAFALEALSDSGVSSTSAIGRKRPRTGAWIVAGALVVAVILAWWMRRPQSEPTAPLKLIPLTTYPGIEQQPSLSPDGSQVAFSWNGPDQSNFDIYVKTAGPGPPLRLTTDPADDINPAWSPDGSSIAYMRKTSAENQFKVLLMPALGGPERKLADVSTPEMLWLGGPYLSWLPDGKSLVITDQPSAESPTALFLLSVSTGEKRQLTFPPAGTMGDHCVAASPDGRAVTFRRANAPGQWMGSTYVLALDSGFRPRGEPRQVREPPPKKLSEDRSCFTWTADSQRLVFVYDLGLWTLPVSLDGRDVVRGPARKAVETGDGVDWPSVSRTSTRLAYAQKTGGGVNIWRMQIPRAHEKPDPPMRFIASTKGEFAQQYSPDGSKIAFESSRSGGLEIWVCGSEGEDCTQLTSMGAQATGVPAWSPDGRQIAFYSNLLGKSQIFVIPADGGAVRRLTSASSSAMYARWSRSGEWIYFSSKDSGRSEIWRAPSRGGPAAQVTHGGGFASSESPDGKWLYLRAMKIPTLACGRCLPAAVRKPRSFPPSPAGISRSWMTGSTTWRKPRLASLLSFSNSQQGRRTL